MANRNSASALLAMLSSFGGQQTNAGRTNTQSLDQEIDRLRKNFSGINLKELSALETIELMGIFTKAVGMVHEFNAFFDKVKKAHAITTEGKEQKIAADAEPEDAMYHNSLLGAWARREPEETPEED